MLACGVGLQGPRLRQPTTVRLARHVHVARRSRARPSRCQGGDEPRHGTAAEAELQSLMMRLREDDVEYFDLKTMCKARSLGGKDTKDNLRAKLLRSVRQDLGLPVYGPENVSAASVRLPQQMTEEEMRHLFDSRGCMMPTNQWQAVGMANALLIADGLLSPDQVMWPDPPVDWSTMTVAELRAELMARKLNSKGLKDELIERLRAWDASLEQEAAQHAHAEAAAAEAAAAEGVSPSATNNAQLHAAQELFAGMKDMQVQQLRSELALRGLKVQGIRQTLMAKLTEALERDVARALGGERRLAQWAASAVARMEEGEVLAELEARGVAQYSSPDEARNALQAAMQRDWVLEALHGGHQPVGGAAAASEDSAWADDDGAGGYVAQGDGYGGAAEEAGPAYVTGQWSGRPGDPDLSVALLCGGHTQQQRDAALAAARLAVHHLQSDPAHGLLPASQLAAGEGAERQGVAVRAVYAAGGQHLPLTWEALHTTNAAELDARLALQPSSNGDSAAEELAAADVLLLLGAADTAADAVAAAGDRAIGSGGSGAAALAADRRAFAARAADLGFATVPCLRLRLADFADAAGAARLADLAAYRQLDEWAAQHVPPGAAPRLALRVEVGGAPLGGALISGTRDALLAALALMHEHDVGEVLVEAVHPGARHVTCSVLATEQGVVALPPTELSHYDVEDDINETALRFERFLALREGLDPEGVDALLELLRQEQAVHPGYTGGTLRPSQQLRQSTPPAGLSAEASQAVRQASVKLFQQLGLRDYAQFSGWVLPPRLEQQQQQWGAGGGAQQQQQQQQQQQEQQQEQQEGEAAGKQQQQQQPQGKSFAELMALDAEVRAAQAEAAAAATFGAAASDAAAAESGSSLLAGELAAAGEAAAAQTYGTYNGIVIDDSTRGSIEDALEAAAALHRPAPLAPPMPMVEALEDLSAADPRQLCHLPAGQVVAFAQLSVVLDLGNPASVLCQQAAAVGLTQESLLRHLVSVAAVRAGKPALPVLPDAAAAAEARAAERGAAAEAEAVDAAGVEVEPGWAVLAQLERLDEAGVEALLAEPAQFSAWCPPAGDGEDAGPGFEFVDATADPSADPVAQAQAAEWDAEAAEAAGGLPYSYDEIRGDYYSEAAANVHVADPAGYAGAAPGDAGANLEHMHPTRQRVWVLLGGDGPGRTQSLLAGLHAYLSLRQNPELLVEAYLLEPEFVGAREEERRRRLLDRRLDLMQMGVESEWIQQNNALLDLARIRHPPGSGGRAALDRQHVWRLSDSGLLRAEVEDLQVACEAALATANASLATLEERGGDIVGVQLSVARQELELAGLPLDGSPWGCGLPHKLEPAQYMHLGQFASEAQDVGAAVFLALGGQPSAHGPLQRLFADLGVPCTGSGYVAAETCADKAALMEQLLDLETSGISTAPQQKISLPELAAACGSEESAGRLFEQLRAALNAGAAALCIKPAVATGLAGLGAMRAASGRDLMVYAQAVEAWDDGIPGELLEGGDGADVAMPVPPPSAFVVEPFVMTEEVQLVRRPDGTLVPPASLAYPAAGYGDALAAALHWPSGSNQWLRVDAVVLGETGRMRCLGATVHVQQVEEAAGGAPPGSPAALAPHVQRLVLEEEAAEAEAQQDGEAAEQLRAAAAEVVQAAAAAAGAAAEPQRRLVGGFDLTPPPPTLVLAEAVGAARVRLEIVADRLALSGAAEITAYMHAETGELVISDVSTLPDLSPGALIFRQAAANPEAPMSPADVFHELIRVGLTQPAEEREELGGLGYSDLGEESADYPYPQDAAYSSYPSGSGWEYQQPQEQQQWSNSG